MFSSKMDYKNMNQVNYNQCISFRERWRMIVAYHRHEEDEIIYVFEAPSIKLDREILHYIRLEPEHAWVRISEML